MSNEEKKLRENDEYCFNGGNYHDQVKFDNKGKGTCKDCGKVINGT